MNIFSSCSYFNVFVFYLIFILVDFYCISQKYVYDWLEIKNQKTKINT